MLISMIKTYSELQRLNTLKDRFDYLKVNGIVCEETFYGSRFLNQRFYNTPEWKQIRNFVIRRDNGCEMGLDGYYIPGFIVIHHINPITKEDLLNDVQKCLDPEFLVCVSSAMHKAIHYSDDSIIELVKGVNRSPNDTTLWR